MPIRNALSFRPHPRRALGLLGFLAPPMVFLSSCGASSSTPMLEAYVSPSRIFALHKPPGWRVSERAGSDSFSIAVTSPDGASSASLLWQKLPPATGRRPFTALEILGSLCEVERKSHPDAVSSESLVSQDGTRAATTQSYRSEGTDYRSRTFVETDGRSVSVQSYAAPLSRLKEQRPLLMNVLLSVALIKAPQGPVQESRPPIQKTMVERRAPDGSLRVRVPQDWGFLAGKGMVVAGEPGAGFIFSAFAGNPMLPGATVLQGVIGRNYLPPAQTLPVVLVGFGHRNPVVTWSQPDSATAARYRRELAREAEAADLVATWTSKEGVACMGAFKVVNGVPAVMGQWSSIVAGIWAPKDEFFRYQPVLEQVASSYAVNDAYARQYLQAGLANLRRLQQKTAQAMQSLRYAREDLQRGWEARQARKDYMDSKWDDYRRGNSYWVSDLEGGKVYQTDTHGTKDTLTGDYYEGGGFTWTHFEGQNPRYAAEGMREISSYELEHGAPPP